MFKATWSIVNGLELDVVCEVSDEILANLSNGICVYGNVVYYVEKSRKQALEIVRINIKQHMTQCISEHEAMLAKARNEWKSCM